MTIDPDGEMVCNIEEYNNNSRRSIEASPTRKLALSYPACDGGGGGDEISVDVSGKTASNAGGVAFAPADILHYDGATGNWSMLFDGSDVGIAKNVNAFYREDRVGAPDILYLSFAANQSIPGLGTVTPYDVVKFTPTSLGDTTAGSFAWYLDGSDVGLSTTAERIDALGMDGNRLLISTVGSGKAPRQGGGSVSFADEDVIAFTPTATGATTTGAWAAYFDGSTVSGLAVEDVNGFWDDPTSGDLYISLTNGFNLSGVTGDADDIVRLAAGGGGYTPSVVWNGDTAGFIVVVDGFELAP